MTIDVKVPRSPGWWMARQFNLLTDRTRRNRLQLLHDYVSGNAPLPEGAENCREAYQAFQKKARSNFAKLVVGAVSDRMTPIGFRTAVDSDETGDAEVGNLWERAGMEVRAADTHKLMLSLSESYVIVGAVDPETAAPRITAEDPRFMVGEPDPEDDRRLLAALKVLRDDASNEDRAYLYLPGRETPSGRSQVWVARRKISSYEPSVMDGTRVRTGVMMSFEPRAWEWDPVRSGELPHPLMPVVRFDNEDGFGEYEPHLDILDRINHQILQRLVIATLQAFRQKAIKGLPVKDKAGKEIDYAGLFTADPGSLWQIPKDAEMWESGQVDLTPILSAVKDDVQHLAAVTRTPMVMLMPAGDNQSAEGATFQREGLVFKVDDRISRCSNRWARVMAVALLHAGQAERADLARLRTIWAPTQRLSLAERGDAAVKAINDLPRRSRLIHIWGFSPSEADRMMSEWEYDQLVAAQTAAVAAEAQQAQQQAQDTQGQQDQQQGDGGGGKPPAGDGQDAG